MNLQFRINTETTVVVDSYPRSANSFFEAAFFRAHANREVVAHHSHAAAQVLDGVKAGLPCIVLLREPKDAIASFYELNNGNYSIALCTLEYAIFYEALIPVEKHIIVVETETLETQFHDLMVHLKNNWGLQVDPYHINAEKRAEIMNDVDKTGKARNGFASEKYSDQKSPEERAARLELLKQIKRSIDMPKNVKLLARAKAAHRTLQHKVVDLRS